jgi:hypothetical protein
MSLATHAPGTPAGVNVASVAVVVVDVIILHRNVFATVFVISLQKQFHPVAAVGNPITPVFAVPPVPTFTRNAAGPLFAVMLGEVPKPEEIVGAVEDMSMFGVEPKEIPPLAHTFPAPVQVVVPTPNDPSPVSRIFSLRVVVPFAVVRNSKSVPFAVLVHASEALIISKIFGLLSHTVLEPLDAKPIPPKVNNCAPEGVALGDV